MPGVAARYIPADAQTSELRALDEVGDKEREKRAKLIDHHWAYYHGEHKKPLKVRPGEQDDNLTLNLCGQAIDRLVSMFVAPDAPKIILPGETEKPGDDSPQQQTLDQFWQSINLRHFLPNVARAGFVAGHNFVKMLDADGAARTMPGLSLLDARHMTVYWDMANPERVLWYRMQWELPGEVVRRQDIVPVWLFALQPEYDPVSTWIIIEYERRKMASGWKRVGEDTWQYPFSPVVQWPNMPLPHEFYGLSDLRHAHINDGVNFVLSNTARIIRFHAHPRTITDAPIDEIEETAVDGVWVIPPGSSVWNLEMQSDLQSSMRMLDELRAAFFNQTGVVDVANRLDKAGQITNFGLRIFFSDMLDNVENKRSIYGDYGLAEISRRALIMMRASVEAMPDVIWQDPLPSNRTEAVQAAAQELQLGLTSRRTIAGDLGRDYDAEQERIAEETTDAGETFADQLRRIGERGAFTGAFNTGNVLLA